MSDSLRGGEDDLDEGPNFHSFVVRLWLETSDAESDENAWRGQIIHLPGDERHYFSDISEISEIIESYLKVHE